MTTNIINHDGGALAHQPGLLPFHIYRRARDGSVEHAYDGEAIYQRTAKAALALWIQETFWAVDLVEGVFQAAEGDEGRMWSRRVFAIGVDGSETDLEVLLLDPALLASVRDPGPDADQMEEV